MAFFKNCKKDLSIAQYQKQINRSINNFNNNSKIYNENTQKINQLAKQQKNIIQDIENKNKTQKNIEKEYLLLKNQENVMIQKIKDKDYYKHQFNDKKLFYLAIMGIHIFILIVLFIGLGKIIHPLIATITIIILYTFAVLIYYFKIRRDKNRNYFKYNEYDVNFKDGACQVNTGSCKTNIQKNQRESNESKQRNEVIKKFSK